MLEGENKELLGRVRALTEAKEAEEAARARLSAGNMLLRAVLRSHRRLRAQAEDAHQAALEEASRRRAEEEALRAAQAEEEGRLREAEEEAQHQCREAKQRCLVLQEQISGMQDLQRVKAEECKELLWLRDATEARKRDLEASCAGLRSDLSGLLEVRDAEREEQREEHSEAEQRHQAAAREQRRLRSQAEELQADLTDALSAQAASKELLGRTREDLRRAERDLEDLGAEARAEQRACEEARQGREVASEEHDRLRTAHASLRGTVEAERTALGEAETDAERLRRALKAP